MPYWHRMGPRLVGPVCTGPENKAGSPLYGEKEYSLFFPHSICNYMPRRRLIAARQADPRARNRIVDGSGTGSE